MHMADALLAPGTASVMYAASAAVAGYSSKEIGQITKLKPATVRSKLSRSLAKMREFLR